MTLNLSPINELHRQIQAVLKGKSMVKRIKKRFKQLFCKHEMTGLPLFAKAERTVWKWSWTLFGFIESGAEIRICKKCQSVKYKKKI